MANAKNKRNDDSDSNARTSDRLARVEKLFRLATDDGGSEEERRTAALKCVQMMKEESLTVIPSDELEKVKTKVEGMTRALGDMKKAMNGQFMKGLGVALIAQKFLKL
jgi:hypothetical protein